MEFTVPAPCTAQSFGPANNLLSTLITALIAAHCNVSSTDMWPEDYGPKALTHGLDPYDFVVIGGGVAGSVVASRLSENPNHRVLLIEAGGDPSIESQIMTLHLTHLMSPYDWYYPTISNGISFLGLVDETTNLPAGKMLGGSSGMAGNFYLRGLPRDYDNWESLGNPTWGYYDILPYFRKSENFQKNTSLNREHGRDGPVPVTSFREPQNIQYAILQIARELGYAVVDDLALSQNGFGRYHGILDNGRRMNIARAFLQQKRANLDIIKHAEATRIEFDRRSAADSVRFVYKGTHEMEAKVKKEVIVTAGAIGTPKLLLLSGIGPEIHLRGVGLRIVSDLRVGDNFHDNTRVDIFLKFEQMAGSRNKEIELLDEIYNNLIHRSGPGAVSEIGGFLSTKNRTYPDVQYFFRRVLNISEASLVMKPEILRSLESQVHSDDQIYAASVMTLRPESRGFVRLRSSNYRDPPFIIPNYFHRDGDLKKTVRGIKRLFKFELSPEFRRLRGRFLRPRLPICDLHRYKSTKYFTCYAKFLADTDFNYAGTAKMGPADDNNSVVDPELHVRGVKGLRVMDASIMPKSPSSLSLAATMMIAEKGSDLVKDTWRSKANV